MNVASQLDAAQPRGLRWRRLLVVVAAIVFGQAVLFLPSLAGRKILLPLDILGQPNHYLPHTAGSAGRAPHNFVLSDLVLHHEPSRMFVAQELAAGRFPLWNPHAFGGAPHTVAKLSPFFLLRSLTRSPLVLPWIQVLASLIGGLGIYAFCRRALTLGFWPSAVAAGCFPLTAYFVLWQGYGQTYAIIWLPWLLLAEDRAIRRKAPGAGLAVALLTLLCLVSGQLDVAAQVLLVAGTYAVWLYLRAHGDRWWRRGPARAGAALALGWVAGLALASPEILSLGRYAKTGLRMDQRSQGATERPPAGLAALPLWVLPNFYGTTKEHGVSIAPKGQKNQMEGAAAAYAGVLATLLLAPLAWQSRRHRHKTAFFTAFALVGLAWSFDVPGLSLLFRLPGINLLSHNRLVFVTGLSVTVMAAIGLHVIEQGQVRWPAWSWAPLTVAVGLTLLAASRVALLPASLETQFERAVAGLREVGWFTAAADVREARAAFALANLPGAILCGTTAVLWLLLRRLPSPSRATVPFLGAIVAADLLWFGHGWNTQADPALYYPRIPVLEQVARSGPGRVVGHDCLPALLAQTHGLSDIRGYDAIDPKRWVTLLAPAAAPLSRPLPYATLQWFVPQVRFAPPGDVRLPPVLDMLGVRTVVFRGTPPPGFTPAFAGDDYWALANPQAMPRAFVPRRVEYLPSAKQRLRRLSSPDFDGREVAFVEEPLALPDDCRGRVEITNEVPSHISLAVDMATPGLVVLADLHDPGWQALRDGQPVPILRVNHALRGMPVPTGISQLELHYWPAGFSAGFRVAGVGLLLLFGWATALVWTRWRRRP